LIRTVSQLQSLPRRRKTSSSLKRSLFGSSKHGIRRTGKVKDILKRFRRRNRSTLKAHEEVRSTIADSVIAALAERLTDYIKAYEQAKQERNLLDFNDLLLIAEHA